MAGQRKAGHVLLIFAVLAQKSLLSGNSPSSPRQVPCPYCVCHISAFIRLPHYAIIVLLCLHFPNKTIADPAPGRVPGTSGCFSNSLLKKIRMNSRLALLMYAKGITTSANLSRVINIKERGQKP